VIAELIAAIQIQFVQILYAELLGLFDEKVIEVCAIPMCIRDGVVWTCGDEDVILSRDSWAVIWLQVVMKERKATFQTAGHMGIVRLPAPPFHERPQSR
jgi:hypothetical protein